MASNHYSPGALVRCVGTFRDGTTNTLLDPAGTMTFQYLPPGGSVVNITAGAIVHDGLGVYHYDVPTPITGASGPWAYRFYVTGANQTANINTFVVDASPFG